MSDTPRTDEHRDRCRECGLQFVPVDEYIKLEREVAELRKALEKVQSQLGRPEFCNFCNPRPKGKL